MQRQQDLSIEGRSINERSVEEMGACGDGGRNEQMDQ